MIAILGALLEENDIDNRLIPPQFTIPGEFTDMEINRIGVFSAVRILSLSILSYIQKTPFQLTTFTQIMELTSMSLLFRTSPMDRLDGPPMFKCAISYDTTLALAKQLVIPLNDLLWDPM